jgi:hypothetical protein
MQIYLVFTNSGVFPLCLLFNIPSMLSITTHNEELAELAEATTYRYSHFLP